jgi:Zn-dependent peptidase ImmA (M78 family)
MKEIVQIEVNGAVLTWARESLALSRNQACEKSGISAKRLIQLETTAKPPTVDELKALSKAYKRTIATLLLRTPPKEKPLPSDKRTVDSKELGHFHEKTIIAVRKARALTQSYLDLRNEMGLSTPRFNLSSTLQDKPDQIAKNLRRVLNLDEIRKISNINFALEAYIEQVESLGIAVFQLCLTQDRLRGLSIVDEIVPIIGIRRGAEPTHSKIFTLFHELGHILLNEGGLCDLSYDSTFQIEKWCNAFAAEILVPSSELLKSELVVNYERNGEQIWRKTDLIALGESFHVGPLAILRRLLDNGLTTVEFYRQKHQAWNKSQFGRSKHPEGRNIPKETIKEKGRTYISLAFSAFDQNRIDLKDLSDLLGIRLSYIPKTRQLFYS